MLEQAPRPRYCSWLLRCWELRGSGGAGGAGWRFSLEDPHSGERRAFAGLDALVAFLRAELALGCDEPPAGAAPAPQAAGQASRQEDG